MIHWIEEGRLEGETLVVQDGDTEWAAASVCLATLKVVAAAAAGTSTGGRETRRANAGGQLMSNAESPVEGGVAENPRGLSRRHDSIDV